MNQQTFIQYLEKNQLQLSTTLEPTETEGLFALFLEKQNTITALDAQLTKAKAQHLKNTKLISTLQDKITQLSPNNNNTGSSFMMPSQFRQCFQQFVKNDFVNVMSPLLPHSKAYVRYAKQLLSQVYGNIRSKINQKMKGICQILNLKPQNEQKVKISLLKILQDNWESILQNINPLTPSYTNPQIKQIFQNQQFQQMHKKFIKICAYMLLQQKQWELVLPQQKIQQYSKKQHCCIDGWIKEKKPVIMVIQSLIKGQNKHQNLKNYVIPHNEEEQFTFNIEPIPTQKLQPIQLEESINIVERYCYEKVKKKAKNQQIKPLQIQQKKHTKNSQLDRSIHEKETSLKPKQKKKKDKGKSALISDPSLDEIMQFPTKLRKDELPFKKQSKQLRKKANSRKGSVGKIIGQVIEHKENINSRNQNYKQLIKQKITEEPKKTKTQRIYEGKEEDRPLRMTHIKKIRQKYLNR